MNRTWIILIDGCYAEPGRVKGIYPHLHSDYLGATREAERLLRLPENTGKTAVIYQSIAEATKVDIVWETMELPDNLPF